MKATFYEKVQYFLKQNKAIVVVLLIAGVLGGFAKFTDSVVTIKKNLFYRGSTLANLFKLYEVIPFDNTKNSFNVLLLPFEPLEQCTFKETHIETAIIRRLDSLNTSDNLNLQIKFDTLDCIHNYDEADRLGKKMKASLVIWGDLYEHCSSDTTEACLKYLNLSSDQGIPGSDNKGTSGLTKLASLSEMKQGKLQKNIDYILYWTAASRSINAKDYKSALNLFKKVEKIGKQPKELLFSIAICYNALGQIKDAEKYYVATLEIDPRDAEAHNNYAILLEDKLNNITDAKEHFEIALDINPNYSKAHFNYAILLVDKLNDITKAKKHYEIALKINPNYIEAHINYGNLLWDKLDDVQNAKKHYEIALEIDTNDAMAHTNYANILRATSNDPLSAKKHYERAFEIDSNIAETHVGYAILLKNKLNDIPGAKKHYERALELAPNIANLNYNYAIFLEDDLNDIIGAKKHYEMELAVNPNLAEAHYNYSILLDEKLNLHQEALIQYQRAIQLNSALRTPEQDKHFGL
jgi:tetratricopeptide (TPR) repeat protein